MCYLYRPPEVQAVAKAALEQTGAVQEQVWR